MSHCSPDGNSLVPHSPSSLTSLPPLPFSNLFPPKAPPPLHPNSTPRCNHPPHHSHHLPHVVTTLNRHAWAFHLRNYPDRKFVNTLLHIIDYGALLGFNAANHPQHCKNLASCADKPEAVTSAIDKLIVHSHACGPYLSPLLKDFHLSPLGLAAHK